MGSGLITGLLAAEEKVLRAETRLEFDREGGKEGRNELNSIMRERE